MPGSSPPPWEYRIEYLPVDDREAIAMLESGHAAGWELVTVARMQGTRDGGVPHDFPLERAFLRRPRTI